VFRFIGGKFFCAGLTTEKDLEGYAWCLYEDRNFFGAAVGKLTATLIIGTNPPSYDDDNKLNFHLLSV
jgi:hypothetical protein